MWAPLTLLSFLALSAPASADTSTGDNVSSKLMIQIPHSLYREGGYDHREALFGVPPYGGTIAQQVYYAESDFCDPNRDKDKGYPRDSDGKPKPWQSPFILMVDRGGCTFVQKVRNAQRAGAAAVLIADSTCLCSDLDCVAKTGAGQNCENTEPIMADDGSGSDISIPSFLMFKHDADAVKDELTANRPVQIEMGWSLPNPDDRVEYDLWTTPSDIVTKDFFSDFAPLAKALGKSAYFTPHMYIHNGLKMGCQSSTTGENFCYTLCTNNGRYCATDPDNDLDGGISGADVVRESLRRLCIWENYGAVDGIGAQWWDYVKEFNARCRDLDYFSNEDCIKDAYKHSKVDAKTIENCMAASGGTADDKINTKLSQEILNQEQRGVVVIPTAFVNTAAIRGALSATTVFSAVCAGFSSGTAPSICKKCGTCADAPGCVAKKGVCSAGSIGGGSDSSGGVSKNTFATSMLLVIALFTGVGAWHYKKTQDDMREQVRGILADYLPLEDQDGGHHGNPMDFARGGVGTSLIS